MRARDPEIPFAASRFVSPRSWKRNSRNIEGHVGKKETRIETDWSGCPPRNWLDPRESLVFSVARDGSRTRVHALTENRGSRVPCSKGKGVSKGFDQRPSSRELAWKSINVDRVYVGHVSNRSIEARLFWT